MYTRITATAVREALLAIPERAGAVPIHQPWFLFGHSKETSDFLADGLDLWWRERKAAHAGVKRLHIELDNGSEVASSRTHFLKRVVEFADRHRVTVEWVDLPLYPSKSNPVERCWGILERHWNGALLSTVADGLRWAGMMTWRGIRPIIRQTTAVCERGVRLTKAAFRPIAERLTLSTTLPKWSVNIRPQEPGGECHADAVVPTLGCGRNFQQGPQRSSEFPTCWRAAIGRAAGASNLRPPLLWLN